MDIVVHASDFANSARDFHITKKGSWYLFEEFFFQGDCEKEQNLPVSFLCDRDTTFISKSQPGFLKFVVIPLYKTMIEMFPDCKRALDNCYSNVEQWENYEETDKDKRAYDIIKKTQKNLIKQISRLGSYQSLNDLSGAGGRRLKLGKFSSVQMSSGVSSDFRSQSNGNMKRSSTFSKSKLSSIDDNDESKDKTSAIMEHDKENQSDSSSDLEKEMEREAQMILQSRD